jgi:replicative DNA helicase
MRRVDLAADGTAPGDTARTGFPSVDRWLGGGIRRGDLVVLAGDVGSGKSALALAMAMRMAQDGTRAAFLTTEMTVERVMERAVAIEGRVRMDDLRQGALDDVARASVGGAAVRIRDAMPIVEQAPSDLGALGTRLRDLGREGIVVFLDSLQGLGAVPALGLDEEEAATVRFLKRQAVEHEVAIVLTTQLRRRADAPADHRPALADLGAKDAIRHHADVVTALYREEMYHPGGGVEGGTEFLVLKNRNGTTGYVDLYFYKQWLRFEDMLDPDR